MHTSIIICDIPLKGLIYRRRQIQAQRNCSRFSMIVDDESKYVFLDTFNRMQPFFVGQVIRQYAKRLQIYKEYRKLKTGRMKDELLLQNTSYFSSVLRAFQRETFPLTRENACNIHLMMPFLPKKAKLYYVSRKI